MQTIDTGLVLSDRYVVGEQIGAGSGGTVWRAHDRVLDRPVACKVVPAGPQAARLQREAQASAGVRSRNVVAVYDHGSDGAVSFLVMELVIGLDLADLLAHGPLSPELGSFVARELAGALAAVHDAGLVHRDLSPGNVLLSVDGEVKLADLGIARGVAERSTRQLTETGAVIGTVDYLAPEQVEGEPVTPATDVYALGLVLHAALTGSSPFGDGSVAERLARRVADAPAPLEDVGGLAQVVAHATRRVPDDRPADGAALVELLHPLVPRDDIPLRDRLAALVRERARAYDATETHTTTVVLPASVPPSTSSDTEPGGRDSTMVLPPARSSDDADSSPHEPVPSPERAPVAPPAPAAAAAPAPPPEPASAPAGEPAPAQATAPEPAPGPEPATASADPTPTAAEEHDEPADSRWLLQAGAAVLGLLLLVALLSTNPGDGDGGADQAQEPASTSTSPAPIPIVAADGHDPLGDGDEHDEDAQRAIDGDPATEWDTEGYESRALGGLKAGVGLLLDLGDAVDVRAVELDLPLAGVDVTVTVSSEPPGGDPTASATVLGSAPDAGGSTTITGESAVTGRWVTVWFTSLSGDGGRNRAAVSEVRVLGP